MDIRDLVEHAEFVSAGTTIEDVSARFLTHGYEFMAVCDGAKVVGLCSRGQMHALLSGRYGFALHCRCPIGQRLLSDELLYSADDPLQDLLVAAFSREGEAFLHDALIIDGEGGLVGLASMRRLVAAQGMLVQKQVEQLAAQRAELTQANSTLAHTLAQQTLLEQQVITKEKAELVQTLVAGIAHELNNKLMPVLGYAELLIAEVSSGDHTRVMEYSRTLRDAAEESAHIVRQILQLSRPVVVEQQRVDLSEVVEHSLTLVALRLRENGVALDLVMPEQPVVILGDPAQVKQVVLNLALNAIDAMEGVPHGRLEVIVSAKRDNATLAVRDRGTGIPPENLSRIFDPFFTTKGPARGTGLGLGVCAAIARQHCGSIEVTSALGVGSTFTVMLPLAEVAPEPARAVVVEAAPSSVNAAGRSVLIVDDDFLVSRVVGDTVRHRLGIHAEHAADVSQAQRVLQTRHFDLIVCDVRMPVVSGLELLSWLRRRNGGQVRNFILMTGEMGHTPLDNEVLLANVPVLRKPFTADTLCRQIRDVLEQQAA